MFCSGEERLESSREKPIDEEIVKRIVEAGQRAPSACNLQTYTIIWVKDPKKRKEVLSTCGNPDISAPVVLVICADLRRLARTLSALGYDHCLKHGEGHTLKIFSLVDASLAAENMTIATECYGFGSLFIGSALANKKLIQVLGLGKGVLPISLLCIGYPDEEPPTRPRLPLSVVLHIDNYKDPSCEELESSLKHMNDSLEREGYYRKYSRRGPSYMYSDHIKRKTDPKWYEEHDIKVEEVLKETGFMLGEVIDI